jgi:hypothetical protein
MNHTIHADRTQESIFIDGSVVDGIYADICHRNEIGAIRGKGACRWHTT